MSQRHSLNDDEREELVAYLDGEADAPVAERMQEKLTLDPATREEARSLGETWELLDFLPLPQAPQTFTQRTVQSVQSPVVSTSPNDSMEPVARPLYARGWFQWSFVAASLVLFAVGWQGARLLAYPSRQLVENLPVLEHYDELRAVREMAFLQMLEKSKHFESPTDAPRQGATP